MKREYEALLGDRQVAPTVKEIFFISFIRLTILYRLDIKH